MNTKFPPSIIRSDDRILQQYESLRSQVLRKEKAFTERSLGLALFIRQGMLAWIEACDECTQENSVLDKQSEIPIFSYEIKSEMIKVIANITLCNLEEAYL